MSSSVRRHLIASLALTVALLVATEARAQCRSSQQFSRGSSMTPTLTTMQLQSPGLIYQRQQQLIMLNVQQARLQQQVMLQTALRLQQQQQLLTVYQQQQLQLYLTLLQQQAPLLNVQQQQQLQALLAQQQNAALQLQVAPIGGN